MANVLIIDDDRLFGGMVSELISTMGHTARCVFTLDEGLKMVSSEDFDVVLLDVQMPDGSGLDLLPRMQSAPCAPEVIIITGFGDPDGAELAIRSGAWDYVEKSSSIRGISLPLTRALQYRKEKLARKSPVRLKRERIVGTSPRIEACLDLVAKAANSEASVLITGETGTGKELFARAIHDNSSRAHRGFVVLDCTALPETLVESLLFGHRKGAFTGAVRAESGLIRQAHEGTLFLDEVGELPLQLQKSFLRVLQERRFRPIGAKDEIQCDFRLVAATNRDLEAMVQQGRFRSDLLFRLRTVTISLPPLRERKADIHAIALQYVANAYRTTGKETKGFSPEFLEFLTAYDWPGNVRELLKTIESAILAAGPLPILFPKHLPEHLRVQVTRGTVAGNGRAPVPLEIPAVSKAKAIPTIQEVREAAVAEAEKGYLKDLLTATCGDVKKACRTSGLSKSRFYDLLKLYGISRSG